MGPQYVNNQSRGALPDCPVPGPPLCTQGPGLLCSQMRMTFCEEAVPKTLGVTQPCSH